MICRAPLCALREWNVSVMSGQDIFKVHGQVSAQAQRLGYVTKNSKNVPQSLQIRRLCSKLEKGSYHCFKLPPPTASWRIHEKTIHNAMNYPEKKMPQYNLIWYFPGNDTLPTVLVLVNECVILDRNQSSMLKWSFEVETERIRDISHRFMFYLITCSKTGIQPALLTHL